MTRPPHLDRLTALLGGLAPRVNVVRPDPGQMRLRFAADHTRGLWLHLLLEGAVEMRAGPDAQYRVLGPAMVVCRNELAHELTLQSPSDTLLCTRVQLEGPVAPWLLAEFDETRVVPLADANTSLQQMLSFLRTELNEPRCGQPLLLDRAGDILFIGLLRHLMAHSRTGEGLFHGLSDPRLAATLVALHAEPERDWRLETMAERAGMSRTAFANRFREALRTTPGKYLSELRLALAQRAVASGDGLKSAARRTGYTNASALSRALSKARARQA